MEDISQEKAKFLPNPEGLWDSGNRTFIPREQCIPECSGCNKMFSDENIGDVCIAYVNPKIKWKNYRVETGSKKEKGKDVKIYYHYNPCFLASHVRHSPKEDKNKKRSGWKKGKTW